MCDDVYNVWWLCNAFFSVKSPLLVVSYIDQGLKLCDLKMPSPLTPIKYITMTFNWSFISMKTSTQHALFQRINKQENGAGDYSTLTRLQLQVRNAVFKMTYQHFCLFKKKLKPKYMYTPKLLTHWCSFTESTNTNPLINHSWCKKFLPSTGNKYTSVEDGVVWDNSLYLRVFKHHVENLLLLSRSVGFGKDTVISV